MTTSSLQIRISRRKLMRSRLAGPGPAWKWLYDVSLPDGIEVIHGADLLSIARREARAAAIRVTTVERVPCTVVCSWEQPR